MRGMLDRIEDGMFAVILLEEQQRELIVPLAVLPEGSRVNSWLHLEMAGGEIESIRLDEAASAEKQEQVQSLLDRVKKKSAGSRFKRN